MAIPTLDKTWQFNVNQVVPQGTGGNTWRRMMRLIKNSLIGFGSSPWTVRGSSNSVSGAMDTTDRWSADTDLVWSSAGGVAHSWIVLRQTGIATNYELLIDLTAASSFTNSCQRYISPSAGFTGGSNTTRPTATDEIQLPASSQSFGPTSADGTFIIHAMQSTDGQCTYVFLMTLNYVCAILMFFKPKNPVSGWTNPSAGMWETENIYNSSTANDCADASIFQSTTPSLRGRGVSTMDIFLTTEGYNGQTLSTYFTTPNDFNGQYPMLPVGVASVTTSNRGRHGQVFDLWAGNFSPIFTGYTYPSDTSRQFCQFGIFIVPWNGSIPVTG